MPSTARIPRELAAISRHPFVGRGDQRRQLAALWARATAATAPVVGLVCGDAGIGKSRLAAELARDAGSAGALCLYGRCDEEPLGPYRPVVAILRQLVAALPQLVDACGPAIAASTLPLLLPELPTAPRAELDASPDLARLRLFDAMVALMRAAAGTAPLLLVVDDLHWADTATLRLLRHVIRDDPVAPALVLCAYRDVEARGAAHPLRQLIATIRREAQSDIVQLAGLSEPEVSQLVALSTDARASTATCAAIHRATEGNPLFVEEFAYSLNEGRPLDAALPEGIVAVIARRLERLDRRSSRVLSVAAIIGHSFDLEVLAGVTGRSPVELAACLDEAVAARVLVEPPGIAGRYSFAHGLLRRALYEQTGRTQRALLHRRIATILESAGTTSDESRPGALAYHLSEAAGDAETAGRALDFARQAAVLAMAASAYEDAAEHLVRALTLAAIAAPGDAELRCGLLLATGDAHAAGGDAESAARAFGSAAELARDLHDGKLLARAALGLAGPLGDAAVIDERRIAVLEEAAAALDSGDSALRARVLARLSIELYYVRSAQVRRRELSDAAVEMATRIGDDAALGFALHARHHAAFRPDNVGERLDIANRMLAVAERAGDRELQTQAHYWRVVDLAETADMAALKAEIDAHHQLAEELREPLYRWQSLVLRTGEALRTGDCTTATRLAAEQIELGQGPRPVDAMQFYGVHLFDLSRLQGTLADLEASVRVLAEEFPAIPAWQAGLALILAQSDRTAEAAQIIAPLIGRAEPNLPIDSHWVMGCALLGDVVAVTGDRAQAAVLRRALEPFSGGTVVVGFTAHGYGPVDRVLGRLDAVLGHWAQAAAHFDAAIELAERTGSRTALAWTRRDAAAALLAEGTPAGRDRAIEMLRALHTAAAEMGAPFLSSEAARMLPDLGLAGPLLPVVAGRRTVEDVAAVPSVTAHTAPAVGVFAREGEFWTVASGTEVVRLRDSRGLQYIAELLRRPGIEVHALDLVGARGTEERAASPADAAGAGLRIGGRDGTPADAFADADARRAYRERVIELRAEIEEARGFHDPVRAERCQAELDALTRELTRGLGLSGRRRPDPASASERARTSVAKAIHHALVRIADAEPDVGHALRTSIRTGTLCVYDPGPTPRVAWRVDNGGTAGTSGTS